MFKFYYILKAKFFDAPFFLKEHWQQFYVIQKDPLLLKDRRYHVIIFDNHAKVGDVVNVLKESDKVHKYTITRISYAEGGDWGPYSNKQFDLQYNSTFYENKN